MLQMKFYFLLLLFFPHCFTCKILFSFPLRVLLFKPYKTETSPVCYQRYRFHQIVQIPQEHGEYNHHYMFRNLSCLRHLSKFQKVVWSCACIGHPFCTWWRLFQKRVVRTTFDIYVFIYRTLCCQIFRYFIV